MKLSRSLLKHFSLTKCLHEGSSKWLYTNCAKQINGFKMFVAAILKVLKQRPKHARCCQCICVNSSYCYNTTVRSSSLVRNQCEWCSWNLPSKCLSISELYNCLCVGFFKGFRTITWHIPMSTAPMWIMFLKLEGNYRNNSDGVYVYVWIHPNGYRTAVRCSSMASKQIWILFVKLQRQCWSIPIGLNVCM